MKFAINHEQMRYLRSKNKIQNYLNNLFSKDLYLKISEDSLLLYSGSMFGAFEITLQIEDNDSADTRYLSVDKEKWMISMEKFAMSENRIIFNVLKNNIVLSEEGSRDIISLGVNNIPDSEAINLEDFIDKNRPQSSIDIDLTEDLVKDIEFAASCCNAPDASNAIGINNYSVIYADRALVLKVNLSNILENIGEDYLCLHKSIANLFTYLSPGSTVEADPNLSRFYFEDGNSRGVISGEDSSVGIPTEEDLASIAPNVSDDSTDSFSIKSGNLKSGLEFFRGFIDNSQWKPIIVSISANKEVNLKYEGSSSITKCLNTETYGSVDRDYTVSSSILDKLLSKAINNFGSGESVINIAYDDESPSIFFEFMLEDNPKYEAMLAKLE